MYFDCALPVQLFRHGTYLHQNPYQSLNLSNSLLAMSMTQAAQENLINKVQKQNGFQILDIFS